ncbi:alpha-D-glucose phosphate-specific phosphoglucomutase [Salinarimonas ramus]|uniref:phosphoglucomutase (alpha-D-glucose-1,6-bisphosphate-dependent) n=1 Tax=Salinarimonas ramus TaxID=690164 RepID=A0A917Q8E7_9HYPH|nr:alpha-D-glucose phosphate-specific phosphoglucomutase [Salinarimonas ramus]GGK34706.1 alpha-D-glucose phosphate-specific phosphoglucomutase [Salinarimonas ramus]
MTIAVETVETTPFQDQKPGTSGLRKKTAAYRRPHYVETFVQAILDGVEDKPNATLVVGGDGRYLVREVVQTIIRMAAANGVGRLVVGAEGLLSTPAASGLIRKRRAAGGIVLSASHNPGGPDGDFGIKFNVSHGGPAPASVTEAIYARTKTMNAYRIVRTPDLDLGSLGEMRVGDTLVEIVDPVADYAELMAQFIDLDAIAALFARGFRMRFDAMSAITGPYAKAILEERLGAPEGTVVNGTPLPDFGGHHPDPNPVHNAELVSLMTGPDRLDFAAASDGDGDRNMIVAPGMFVTPSDSLAILAAHAHLAPGYADGVKGVARSMPTSRAADRVAEALGVEAYETPTGWKYFANLLDAGMISICGEESAGTGSFHVREKDGLWAVLLWLNILAKTGESADALVRAHWSRYGRDYYQRHDYEEVDAEAASALMEHLRARLPALPGSEAAGLRIEAADDFAYTDPVDGSVAESQGIRIYFANGGRAVFRLSGTGTAGATLRVYLERYEPADGRHDLDVADALAEVVAAARAVAEIEPRTGRAEPSVIT